MSGEHPAQWRVASIGRTNALGYPTSYVLHGDMSAMPLVDPTDPPLARAGFAFMPQCCERNYWSAAHHLLRASWLSLRQYSFRESSRALAMDGVDLERQDNRRASDCTADQPRKAPRGKLYVKAIQVSGIRAGSLARWCRRR